MTTEPAVPFLVKWAHDIEATVKDYEYSCDRMINLACAQGNVAHRQPLIHPSGSTLRTHVNRETTDDR